MLSFSNSTASLPMSTESQLHEKLRKIEALFAGAGTAGERLAAEAALERVRERLGGFGRQDPSIEMQFSMPDQWSRHLFLALCRRYGMRPYRYYRQRRNTVMVRAPKRFLDQVLWPEFSELDQALQAYLHQLTLRVIREEVYADASEAQEVSDFFFQAEDGIRYYKVTGVQTCALPICSVRLLMANAGPGAGSTWRVMP